MVHILHSRWAKEGEAVFDVGNRGGRRHQCLSLEQEEALLAPFEQRAQAGGIPSGKEIQAACERRMGRAVAASMLYRLLARHGWRKVASRPRHLKVNSAGTDRV